MPLLVEYDKIVDRDKHFPVDEDWVASRNPNSLLHEVISGNPLLDSVIWSLIGIGMGAITEENIDEVVLRLRISDQVYGGGNGRILDTNTGKHRFVSREMVAKMVNLSANISEITFTEFMDRMSRHIAEEAIHDLDLPPQPIAPRMSYERLNDLIGFMGDALQKNHNQDWEMYYDHGENVLDELLGWADLQPREDWQHAFPETTKDLMYRKRDR